MGTTIINIVLYLLQAFFFYYYCNSIFNSKYKKSTRLLWILLGFTVLFFVFLLGKVYINGPVIVLTIFLIVYFVYGQSVLSALFQGVLYLALLAGTEYISIPLVNILYKLYDTDFHEDFHGYLFVVLISKTLQFVCMMLLIWIFNRNKSNSVSKKGMILTLTVPLSNVAILTMVEYISRKTQYNREMNIVWGIIAGLLLLVTFLLLYNRSYLVRQADKISELILEKQKRELDEQYFSIIEKKNDDMQILAHDFKNHLATIRNMDSLEEADDYIDKIYPAIEKFNTIGVSKNKTLDLVLSKYVSLCEIKNVEFSFDVKTANLHQLDSVDLTALLNNLLDNAVEAAAQSAGKKITLVLKQQSDYMDALLLHNSCDSAPQENAGNLISRKADKEAHGFGTKSIRKIAEKYGGIYDWQYDEKAHLFTTSILFAREQKR